MAAPRAPALYSPALLAMAVELADYPFDAQAIAVGEARSRSCGSVISLSSVYTGRLERIGLKVSACAVGQASAAIFAREAGGMDAAAVSRTMGALGEWLEGDAAAPALARIDMLEPARAYRARHGAILLPWKAALDALSKGGGAG
ncbi:iron-sulfur cluster assembly scaffold protein [Qipengyuania citrea]|jgi:NifU-like protein involved in Fe-S cluster formation|uniref:iron-sulfur cluster assembly scaffold protein n=1 Tax=Qipengyuania citrea TaxID=225971 RepID=UPI003298FB6F